MYPSKKFVWLKYVAKASALLFCEKVNVKKDHIINKKEPFFKRRKEKDVAVFRKDIIRIGDWFKGQRKNCSA